MQLVIFFLGFIVFLAHLFTAFFKRTRIPDVLLLTVLGIFIGPVLGIVQPEMFGKVGGAFSTIALIVILFEGGTNLRIDQLRESIGQTLGLTLATFLGTIVLVSAVTMFVSTRRDFEDIAYKLEPGVQEDVVTLTFAGGTPVKIEKDNLLYLKDQEIHAKVLQVVTGLDKRVIQARVGMWHVPKERDIAQEMGETSLDSAFIQEGVEYAQVAYTIQRSTDGDLLTLALPANVDISFRQGDSIRLLDQAAAAPIVSVLSSPKDEAASADAETLTTPESSNNRKFAILRLGTWNRPVDSQAALELTGVGFFYITGTRALFKTQGTGIQTVIKINLLIALLIGSVLGGTSASVVVPLVGVLRMAERPGTVLILESAITDVLCIVVALNILQSLSIGRLDTGKLAGDILASFVGAGVIGVLGAFVWSVLLRKVRQFPNTIFTTFAFIFMLYGIAETLGWSGAITALSFGITLVSAPAIGGHFFARYISPNVQLSEFSEVERSIFSEVVFLLKTFFFLYLGLSLQFTDVTLIGFGLVATLLVYIARPFLVRFLVPRDTSKRDASLMAIMVPKGLAAAVLASLPRQEGIVLGETIEGIVYAVIFFSLIFSAVFVFLLEKEPIRSIYHTLFSGFGEPVSVPPVSDTAAE